MDNLSSFTVIYVERNNASGWGAFNCWAEDQYQAQEQCEIAYPDVDVIWVNCGHDNTNMEEFGEVFDDPL